MSTPAPSPTPGALHAAQQQLDELDALIQRMLRLPSNPEEPAPAEMNTGAASLSEAAASSVAASSPEPRGLDDSPAGLVNPKDSALPGDSAKLNEVKRDDSVPGIPGKVEHPPRRRVKAAPPPAEPDELVELLPPLLDPLEVEFRPVPLASDLPAEGEDDGLAPAEPFHAESAAGQYEEAADEYADEEAEHEAVVARTAPRGPLVRANQAFDRVTYPFGAAGYWLRSAVGRDVLGWFGVLLISGSVAWAVLDWLGWTW